MSTARIAPLLYGVAEEMDDQDKSYEEILKWAQGKGTKAKPPKPVSRPTPCGPPPDDHANFQDILTYMRKCGVDPAQFERAMELAGVADLKELLDLKSKLADLPTNDQRTNNLMQNLKHLQQSLTYVDAQGNEKLVDVNGVSNKVLQMWVLTDVDAWPDDDVKRWRKAMRDAFSKNLEVKQFQQVVQHLNLQTPPNAYCEKLSEKLINMLTAQPPCLTCNATYTMEGIMRGRSVNLHLPLQKTSGNDYFLSSIGHPPKQIQRNRAVVLEEDFQSGHVWIGEQRPHYSGKGTLQRPDTIHLEENDKTIKKGFLVAIPAGHQHFEKIAAGTYVTAVDGKKITVKNLNRRPSPIKSSRESLDLNFGSV